MIKKLLCLLLNFTGSFGVVFSMEQKPEVEEGDWGIPLIPRAHSYNCLDSNIEFFRLLSTSSGNIILSIQPMISSGVDAEEISFKPQWTIFKDVSQHFYNDKFSISTVVDCDLKITDAENTTKEFVFNKQCICFHDPDRVSPDIMHLGFNKESKSKLIEYIVTYSDGDGSEFAKLKNGTQQRGIILLLDKEDMSLIKGINNTQTDNTLLAMLAQTSLGKNPKIFERIRNIFPPDTPDFSFTEKIIIDNSVDDENIIEMLSDKEINEKITNLEQILRNYYNVNLDEIRSLSNYIEENSKFYLSQLSQLALSFLGKR